MDGYEITAAGSRTQSDGYGASYGAGYGASYAYPADFARFVLERWEETPSGYPYSEGAPDGAVLEALFSTCYQASLLREEERPVTFRVILAGPEEFAAGSGPPEGFHVLEFPDTRGFNPRELRRLSVAADFQRTMIGAKFDGEMGLRIWGMVHTGSRWLRDVQGGRRAGAAPPVAPVVHVEAPGALEVRKGYELVGKLERGEISGARADLFESEWMPAEFTRVMGELNGLHEAARERAFEQSGERWAPLEPDLTRRISERMLKRVVSVVSDARHGGTVIFLPSEKLDEICGSDPYVDVKYPFMEGPARVRFRDLIVGILNRKARLHGTTDGGDPVPVGWEHFEQTTDGRIAALDEGVFEVAYLIAGLAATDGAVVMNKEHELLGFGGVVSGSLPGVKTVWRALDLEGENMVREAAEEQGTRHRSAYRIAAAVADALVVVISQDGGVRFVSRKGDRVVYWDQE